VRSWQKPTDHSTDLSLVPLPLFPSQLRLSTPQWRCVFFEWRTKFARRLLGQDGVARFISEAESNARSLVSMNTVAIVRFTNQSPITIFESNVNLVLK
jgi:hypothetical protein